MNELKYLTKVKTDFADSINSVREKEGRVYKDSEVIHLPEVDHDHLYFEEWEMSKKSTERFINYIKNKSVKRILEVGCGNGWFTNLIAKNNYANVFGIDINADDLEQAQRVFKKENLYFRYEDIFEEVFDEKFDIIVLSNSVQYFPDMEVLIKRLKEKLALHGEIHILDSPIYESEKKALDAKNKAGVYFEKVDVPEMAENQFYHIKSDLKEFKIVYESGSVIKKMLGKKETPYKWYMYTE